MDEDAKEKVCKGHPLPARHERRTEAQLWTFFGPAGILHDDPPVHWVAAESLEAALRYMRLQHDDSMITEARLLGMIPLAPAHHWTDSDAVKAEPGV